MNTWLSSDGRWLNPETTVIKCSKCGRAGVGGVMIPHTFEVMCHRCEIKQHNAQ